MYRKAFGWGKKWKKSDLGRQDSGIKHWCGIFLYYVKNWQSWQKSFIIPRIWNIEGQCWRWPNSQQGIYAGFLTFYLRLAKMVFRLYNILYNSVPVQPKKNNNNKVCIRLLKLTFSRHTIICQNVQLWVPICVKFPLSGHCHNIKMLKQNANT